MTLGVYKDYVQETTTSTGAALTLAGATTGYQSFATAFGTNVNVYYSLTSGAGGAWEVGYAAYTFGSTVLTRVAAQVLAGSSGAGNLITISATSIVNCVQPAETIADIGMTAGFSGHIVPQ